MPLRDGTQNRPFARPVGRDQAITAAVQIGGYLESSLSMPRLTSSSDKGICMGSAAETLFR